MTFKAQLAICTLSSLALLTGCGGGGSGGGGIPNPPVSDVVDDEPEPQGYQKGVYPPREDFRHLCENPRSGIAPYNEQPYPDEAGNTTDQNNWLRSMSHELYLWYDDLPDIDPASMDTPDYFAELKTDELTPTGTPKDQFHWQTPTAEYRRATESGLSYGYGAKLTLLNAAPPREAVVYYTEPNSPAAEQNFTRGARILEVDGVDFVYGSDTDTLNAGLFPSEVDETHEFVVQDAGSNEPREITLTSAEVTIASVPRTRVLDTPTGNVGYMLFNTHNRPAEAALASAVDNFRAQGVSDLVLDVRYNGGGYLYIASELAYMIAGSQANGRVFSEMSFNDKHPSVDPVTDETIEATLFYNTDTNGEPFASLELDRVFVLTGNNTCSASEAIINGLQGIDVEVIQIGGATCGKPYGAYVMDNCGTSYFTTMFKGSNDKGYGDFTDGFFPGNAGSTNPAELAGCAVADDYNYDLGDRSEARLSAALHYRETGQCPGSTASGAAKPDLRVIDDGQIRQPYGLGDAILGGRHD